MDEFKLIRAEESEFMKIADFYRYVIANNPTMKKYCRWNYGEHPTDELVRAYIAEGTMYYAEQDGRMLSVIVVLPYQTKEYDEVNWLYPASADEVASLHIFCVNPDNSRSGIGSKTIAAAEQLAKAMKKKVVRLDTLKTNIIAQSFYAANGYTYTEEKVWFTKNAGVTEFLLYEKKL